MTDITYYVPTRLDSLYASYRFSQHLSGIVWSNLYRTLNKLCLRPQLVWREFREEWEES